MKTNTLIEALIDAARQLGHEVRIERGTFRGGRCTVGGTPVIMLNKRQPPEVQLAILAESLQALPVDTIYLKPSVRAALEETWAQRNLPPAAPAEADEAHGD